MEANSTGDILMPLENGSSKDTVSRNIATEIRSGRPKDQAVAIAMRMARAKKAGGPVGCDMDASPYARGGSAPTPFTPPRAPSAPGVGMIHGPTAGREDKKPMSVTGGSYVMPADTVSAIGQGNSTAGAEALSKMFKMGPYGSKAPGGAKKSAKAIRQRFADGGAPSGVDIIASDGEFVVPPENVAELGGGDMDAGHEILDHMVKTIRQKNIKTLKSLPGPKRD